MNSPDSSTSRMRSSSSGISGSYCALTSTSGIGATATQSRGAQSTDHEDDDDEHDACDDDVIDVAANALIAGADGPTHAGEREAERAAADRRQYEEAHERHARDSGRNGDERAHDRRRESQDDGERSVPVEPALRPVELRGRDVDDAAVLLQERAAAVVPDEPADRG